MSNLEFKPDWISSTNRNINRWAKLTLFFFIFLINTHPSLFLFSFLMITVLFLKQKKTDDGSWKLEALGTLEVEQMEIR
jgi:hypothetical protein